MMRQLLKQGFYRAPAPLPFAARSGGYRSSDTGWTKHAAPLPPPPLEGPISDQKPMHPKGEPMIEAIGRANHRCAPDHGLSALTLSRTTRTACAAGIATSRPQLDLTSRQTLLDDLRAPEKSASSNRCPAVHQQASPRPRAEELDPLAHSLATDPCKSGHSLALCALGSSLVQVLPAMLRTGGALRSRSLDCRAEARQGVFHAGWDTLNRVASHCPFNPAQQPRRRNHHPGHGGAPSTWATALPCGPNGPCTTSTQPVNAPPMGRTRHRSASNRDCADSPSAR